MRPQGRAWNAVCQTALRHMTENWRCGAQEAEWWERFKTKRVTGYPAGSLFLWDSRTVHQNTLPRDDQLWR